ncbi:MAG TPA: hypothetical protein VMR62_17615 [Bryobacteraceae bacterium]|nr:hypothetical protein [Bryobacteraceae bacterium]
MARLDRSIEPTGEHLDIEQAGIGWVGDDARKRQELTGEQLELLELAQTLGK